MKSYSSSNRKSLRAIGIACSLFFWIFSMIYLGLFQGDLLSFRVDTLFSGGLQYNPWLGAAVVTALLWLLQRLIAVWIKFKPLGYAFSFLPSFVLLGVITFIPTNYTLPLAVCIVAGALAVSLLLFAFWGRKSTRLSVSNSLNFNLQELLLLCCVTVAIGNTDEDLHHELAMSKAIEKGDYTEVLKIGRNSLSVSPKMADYRIRAMLATGQTGMLLFEYPQYYTSMPALSGSDTPGGADADRMMARRLLNKDLKGIYDRINENGGEKADFYDVQAAILYEYLHPALSPGMYDESLTGRFRAFMDLRSLLKSEGASPLVETNKMRREFGTTFWFYYYYNAK